MDDELLTDIIELALRWRYEHPGHAEINRDQQMVDGGELLTLLRSHDIHIPMDFAMKEIPAPGAPTRLSEAELQRLAATPREYLRAADLDALYPDSEDHFPLAPYSQGDFSCDLYYGMGT